jgi:hypothetical protein
MQTAQTQSLVDQLKQAGVTLSLTATGALAVSPASQLTDDLRALIRADKAGLIDWVKAANDLAPLQTAAATHIGTARLPGLSPKLLAASLILDAQIAATGLPPDDPDSYCWPYSEAMNGGEIDLFAARLFRITDKGVIQIDAQCLADRLVIRDRDLDDRALCLECQHLHGHGPQSWRCGNWQRSGVAIKARDTGLPADLVLQLQRCDGFTNAINTTTKVS